MRYLVKFLFIMACLLSKNVYCSIDSDLNNYFNKLGFDTNVTAPNAYKGQTAGYYTGGSLFTRDTVRDLQVTEIELPSFNSGCGGIDLFTGGFSFVNAKDFVNEMKNIMNNSEGYIFNLALESALPEMANSMKYINSIAHEVNRFNINSCETSAELVGSVWPRTRQAQQQVCQDIAANSGALADYAAARQACGASGNMDGVLARGKNMPGYKDIIIENSNLAWKALLKNGFLRNDIQLAELFMSLSGSIILQHQNGNKPKSDSQHYRILTSLANDSSLLKALLHGGEAKIYICDDNSADGCLNPSLKAITISKDHALAMRIKQLLNDIVSKIQSDEALTETEIGLLNATQLPIYKMLNVQVAFAGDKSVLNIDDYADIIAINILFSYLDESLSIVRTSALTLQYPEALMSDFMKGIDQARTSVREAEKNAYTQVSVTAQLIEQSQSLERMLAGNLSAGLNSNLQWANSLRE